MNSRKNAAPEIIQINSDRIGEVTALYKSVFTSHPWNDDWSDDYQLRAYISDLAGNSNSLVFGLFEDSILIGAAIGSIRHWYTGTEYYIDEFFIQTEMQGHGLGTHFLNGIAEQIRSKGIKHIFLQTERSVPAYNFYRKNGFEDMDGHISLVKKI